MVWREISKSTKTRKDSQVELWRASESKKADIEKDRNCDLKQFSQELGYLPSF